MAEGTFGTAINCMDGRTQLPVINWMKKQYGFDYIDMITEAGPDGILATRMPGLTESIKARLQISIDKHGSDTIILVAHGGCAGNPVSKDEHLGHLRKGMETIRSWDLQADLVGLWIDDSNWEVEVVAVINR